MKIASVVSLAMLANDARCSGHETEVCRDRHRPSPHARALANRFPHCAATSALPRVDGADHAEMQLRILSDPVDKHAHNVVA